MLSKISECFSIIHQKFKSVGETCIITFMVQLRDYALSAIISLKWNGYCLFLVFKNSQQIKKCSPHLGFWLKIFVIDCRSHEKKKKEIKNRVLEQHFSARNHIKLDFLATSRFGETLNYFFAESAFENKSFISYKFFPMSRSSRPKTQLNILSL